MPNSAAACRNGPGSGFFVGRSSPPITTEKKALDAGRREMRPHEARRLVRDDRERNPHRLEAQESFDHARKEARLVAEARA
jgi:hypothetical protein